MSLPKGWIETSLGALCSKPQYGYTTKASNEGDVKFLRTTDVTKPVLNWEKVPYCLVNPSSVDKYLLENGDIVISRAGSVGYSCRLENIPVDTVFASYLIRFKPNKLIDGAFIKHFLNAPEYWQQITDVSAGVAVQNINAKKLEVIKLPLPPLNEQKRIAKKLDELLATVESIKTRLDNSPTIIKRFRQSILAAATSGKLTEEWREENGISDKWDELTVDDIAKVGTGNTPLKSNAAFYENADIPWLTSSVTGSPYVKEADKFVTQTAIDECRLKLYEPGTLLVAMYGEGKTRGQVTELTFLASINQACAAIMIDQEKIEKSYLKMRLQENYAEIRMLAEGGNQPNLNLSKVRSITVPIPTREEQNEIVSQVESLFTLADTLEEKIEAAKKRVDKLTQSILAKAFRGELEPQDPNDEPAEKLLERIKAEQKVLKPNNRARKK